MQSARDGKAGQEHQEPSGRYRRERTPEGHLWLRRRPEQQDTHGLPPCLRFQGQGVPGHDDLFGGRRTPITHTKLKRGEKMKEQVWIKGPLAERLRELADDEEMTLEEIVDFILRAYFKECTDDEDE